MIQAIGRIRRAVTLLDGTALLFVHEARSEQRLETSPESCGIIVKLMIVNIFIKFGAGLTL
jgi:hypothetical protein